MTTLTDIFNAFAPEYLERYPNLLTSHQQSISAIQHGRTGPYGHRLYPCHPCGTQHRVHHACGHRHSPQCQPHKTQQWLHKQLANPLPGPHFLITCTVPETLRAVIRAPPRIAYPALFNASSYALKRLAQDERFLGTHLPGFTAILPTWGRQLPSHPPIPSIVPGGGLSKDRAAWLPSRAHFFVPVKALSPIYRAVFQHEMAIAGRLDRINPQVWTIPWNVPSQANPNGATSLPYLAPYGFKVALSNRRIVSLQDRTVTFTYSQPGRARPRTTHLDAVEFIRRFLPHVLPEGFMKVRPFGLMNTRCAISIDTLPLMILTRHPVACQTPDVEAPAPLRASCPTWGAPMRLIMRRGTANQAFFDTG